MTSEERQLQVEGMTCASCVARVERRLERLDGVTASVNLATGTARVSHHGGVSDADLVSAVEAAGYAARVRTHAGHAHDEHPPPDHADPDHDTGGGHEHDHGSPSDRLPLRLAVAAPLTLAVVLLGMLPGVPDPAGMWVALGMTLPVATWCALPIHRLAWQAARHGTSTMHTLVSLGVIVSLGWSIVALLLGRDDVYLEVAAVVTTLVLAGRVLEDRARHASREAYEQLLALAARDATVLRADGSEQRVDVSQLRLGDRLVVRPGERIPTDGVVESGNAAVDVALLTGEPVPVEAGPGTEVVGASLVSGGRLVVRATALGEDTRLAQVARLVEDAQAGKAPVQRLVDRIAAVFVPLVILAAVATTLVWIVLGNGVGAAVTAGVAVLVVACPCALGLATPAALLVGTGRGAQLGLLVRGPQVLEQARRADTVVLDKTGTLTTGSLHLADVLPLHGTPPAEALRIAAAVEAASEHPLGRAVVAALGSAALPAVTDFRATPGLGVEGEVEGRRVVVGRAGWVAGLLGADADVEAAVADAAAGGRTPVVVAWDERARAVLALSDTLRPTAGEAVAAMRRLGMTPYLVTGDHRAAADEVARELGIADVVAEATPEGKVAVVQRLQGEGRVVAMVGDGVNDAAALAQADLGIAVGSGSEIAAAAGDLTLVRDDPLAAVDAVRLARSTYSTIRVNLVWAFGYNVAAIPLAMTGRLSPALASAAMALSSVFVLGNSLRLRRFQPTHSRESTTARAASLGRSHSSTSKWAGSAA